MRVRTLRVLAIAAVRSTSINRTALVVSGLLYVLGVPLSAQWLNHPTPSIPRTRDGKPNLSAPAPRTPDGKPDFSGLWNRISPRYSRNVVADLRPGEVLPWAQALVDERRENLGKGYMNTICVPFGPSYVTSADTTGAEQMKIVQTPALLLILNPDLTYRQVYMDGRALERDPNPAWMGYSVGRWDGDTLIVDSNGYNDRTWLDHDGHPHTEALLMTERYHRRDFGHLDIEVTYSDPRAYTKTWSVSVRAELAPDTEMIEFVCGEREANPGLAHWVGRASDELKASVPVARDVLVKYVGTYVEQPKYWRLEARTVVISVSGDMLYGDMDGRGKVPLIAQSPTLFTGLYGLGVAFVTDSRGVPTSLYVKHVSGDYRFSPKK
jgi:hypothetical protein